MQRVYEVGFVGHSEHRIFDKESTRILVRQHILTLMDQYYPNPVCFNIFGTTGVAAWTAAACAEYGISYHVFLPCLPDTWIKEVAAASQNELQKIVDGCDGLAVASQDMNKESICRSVRSLVDSSDFIVSFWQGHHGGLTYETITYALESSKIVLDGLSDLSLIAKKKFHKSDRGE